ncbi:MAG: hypothetical protein WA738_14650 [Candidatus Angelobacter sp.]
MYRGKLKFGAMVAGILLLGINAFAQQVFASAGAKPSAQGQLTVTATVVSSVGLIVGPDGVQRMIFANAADPRDNVSQLQAVRTMTLIPAPVVTRNDKTASAKNKTKQ